MIQINNPIFSNSFWFVSLLHAVKEEAICVNPFHTQHVQYAHFLQGQFFSLS